MNEQHAPRTADSRKRRPKPTQVDKRVKQLESAMLNMLLCPGESHANGGPNVGGLCEACKLDGRKLLGLQHEK